MEEAFNMAIIKDVKQYDISLLYIEDDAVTRQMVATLLERIVTRLHVAANGREGLELFRAKRPDVVLTDILMPEMSGLEMAQQIRQFSPDCPIVVLTSYNDQEYLLECISIGINRFLQKPVDFVKLTQAISLCNDYIAMTKRLKKQDDLIHLLSQAMEQAPAPVVITSLEGTIEYVNAMFCKVTGYGADEAIGQNPSILKSGINSVEIYQNLWETIKSGLEWECELANRRKNGQIYWEWVRITPLRDKDGNIIKFLKVAQDITERKSYEESLYYLSTHDALTDLYNRAYFDAEIKRLASSRDFPVSIVIADIDGLKAINDIHGHDHGDQELKRGAAALLAAFRAGDVIARIGGDEFAVLLPHTDANTAENTAQRISFSRDSSDGALSKTEQGFSLGIATAYCPAELVQTIKLADRRMYQQKYARKKLCSGQCMAADETGRETL